MNTNQVVGQATKQGYLPCTRLLNITQKILLHLHMAPEDCVHANENMGKTELELSSLSMLRVTYLREGSTQYSSKRFVIRRYALGIEDTVRM